MPARTRRLGSHATPALVSESSSARGVPRYNNGEIMTINTAIGTIAIVLALGFAGFATVYLLSNDFAKETVEAIFPAIGAMLFSFYLAAKLIWVEAPAPQIFSSLVAILTDRNNGIHGVPKPSVQFPPNLDEYRGAELITNIPAYHDFRRVAVTGNDAQDVLEYAILKWLAQPDLAPGANWEPAHKLISGGSRGGRALSHLAHVSIAVGDMRENRLIAGAPFALNLPPGSSVERVAGARPSFQIRTPHSTLSVRWEGTSSQQVLPPATDEQRRLYAAVDPSSASLPGAALHGISLKFEFTQEPFSRFSPAAKAEAAWAIYVQTQFERDFSWEHVRSAALQR
jgi:hypothetical protein